MSLLRGMHSNNLSISSSVVGRRRRRPWVESDRRFERDHHLHLPPIFMSLWPIKLAIGIPKEAITIKYSHGRSSIDACIGWSNDGSNRRSNEGRQAPARRAVINHHRNSVGRTDQFYSFL